MTTIHRTRPTADSRPIAAPAPPPGATIVTVFRDAARSRPDAVALRYNDGTQWHPITWRQYERAVAETAVGLRALGLAEGDRVGILSGNRPEWHIADVAILSGGFVSTPVYSTSSSTQVAHILADSGARVCFVEDGHQLSKLLLRRKDLPNLEKVIVFDTLDDVDDSFVESLVDLQREGARLLDTDPTRFDELTAAITESALATLVYTSGTTGPPKGAMITHANVMATLRSLTSVIDLDSGDRFLSFLPLSHITERCVSHFGQIVSGGETWFARSLATVPDDLRACRPTLFFAVPRVWEKFQETIVERAEGLPPPLRALVTRYLALAGVRGDGTDWRVADRERFEYEALDRTVGRLLRHQLGLDRARMLSSGAAPIHPDLLRWFHGLGLPIGEGYGQTEVTLCTTLNPVGHIRIGTVGRPIPGVQVRIGDDDEILVRGPNVCAGYWKKDEATAALIDDDGWLHSGDLGSIDADGYLRVTGRKKDLIITAYGKNISPSEIETALRREPIVSQAVVIGDGRPFLTAVLTLEPELVPIDDRAAREAVDEAIDRVNALHSHAEGIRRWRRLPHELSVSGGELTPTLKVRREVVTSTYHELIDEMYADQEVAAS